MHDTWDGRVLAWTEAFGSAGVSVDMGAGVLVFGMGGLRPTYTVFFLRLLCAETRILMRACTPLHLPATCVSSNTFQDAHAGTGGIEIKGKGRMDTYIWSPEDEPRAALPHEMAAVVASAKVWVVKRN